MAIKVMKFELTINLPEGAHQDRTTSELLYMLEALHSMNLDDVIKEQVQKLLKNRQLTEDLQLEMEEKEYRIIWTNGSQPGAIEKGQPGAKE